MTSSATGLRQFFAAIGSRMTRGSFSRFQCGDCDRNAECGLPLHDDCIFRLMQIAHDGDDSPRRQNYLYPAVWPHAGARYEDSRY